MANLKKKSGKRGIFGKEKAEPSDPMMGLGSWHKLNILFAVLFLAGSLSFLMFSSPSLTGHVPAVYAVKDLEVVILEDQSYNLISKDSKPLHLKSVLASGKIIGDGFVRIFLENNGDKLLIYSNEQKKGGLDSITGHFIKGTGEEVDDQDMDFVPTEQNLLPEFDEKDAESYPEEFKVFMSLLEGETQEEKKGTVVNFMRNLDEGVKFENECIDTCALFGLNSNSYKFVFEIEDGTMLLVERIIYSVSNVKVN